MAKLVTVESRHDSHAPFTVQMFAYHVLKNAGQPPDKGSLVSLLKEAAKEAASLTAADVAAFEHEQS